MPGYLLMNADVTDPDGHEEYKVEVAKVIASYGGRYLVRAVLRSRSRASGTRESSWWSSRAMRTP